MSIIGDAILDIIKKYMYGILLGIGIMFLMFSVANIILGRAVNGAIDLLKNPFVLGLVVAIIVMSVLFWYNEKNKIVKLEEGDHVYCEHQPKKIYRYTDGQLRHYPNPSVAQSWGSKYISSRDNNHKKISQAQCDGLPRGPPMELNLQEGDHVACQNAPGKVYRYTGGQLRHYPNPDIAKSWGSVWKSRTNNNTKLLSTEICNQLPLGPPMTMNIIEGDHVACQHEPKKIYRYTEGQLRHYPNPNVAKSWGSVWISPTNHNTKMIPKNACDAIPKGAPMKMNMTR